MPTTYTSLLGFALPATGELSGTWGDTVNDYITKYVDASVAGVQTISGSQTAVTLSVTNGTTLTSAGSGATGSAQYSIINCTGNPASALTITAPASSRQYIVVNATSTTQPVKLVGAGPTTGVTIPSGRAALVTWNGSDYVSAQTCIISNDAGATAGPIFDLMRDSASPAASDILGQLLFSGRDSAGNVQTYSYIQAGIEDATSTSEDGNIQFLTVTNGTASEKVRITASGNVGIGTTSPSSPLSIVRTSAGSAAEIFYQGSAGGGADIRVSNGNSSTFPIYSFYNNYTTGISNPGSGEIGFIANANEKVRIDASGNVGIGTSTPGAKLDVASGKVLLSNTQSYAIKTAAGATNDVVTLTSGNVLQLGGGGGTDSIQFWNQGSERMRIDSSGNVGIGTTSPSTYGTFAVQASGGTVNLIASDNGTSTSIQSRIFNSAGTLMSRSSQYGPSYSGGSFFSVGANGFTLTQEANAAMAIGTYGVAQPLIFGTNSSERMRITSGGELVINDTAIAAYFDGKLNVLGRIHNKVTVTTDSNYIWNATTSGDPTFIAFGTETAFTNRGTITYSRAGGVVSYNTTSDYRAKDIIGPVQNPGATIDALKVYEGKMKGATLSRPMLIAHEAQEYAPYSVTGVKDAVNDDGTPKLQQMDVSSLVPLLLAEIQSLRQRIAALESKGA